MAETSELKDNSPLASAVEPADRKDFWIGMAVFAGAIAVRLVYLWESSRNPTFLMPVVDADTYHNMAMDLATKGEISEGFFWQPFLYPFLLGLVYKITGCSILVAKILQAVLGGATCMLSYHLGRRVFGRSVGLIAGIILSLYGPLIFFDLEFLGAGLAAFWSVALMLLMLKARGRQGAWDYFQVGIFGAFAVLSRPTFLPFTAAGMLWIALGARPFKARWGTAARGLALGLAGFLLMVAPVAAVNARHFGGGWSFMPSSGGINLHIGNNPDMCGTLLVRPGWDWEHLLDMPRHHGVMDIRLHNDFYRGGVLDYLADQPLHFLGGLGQKSLRMICSREIPRNVDIYMFRRWSAVLSVLLWKAGHFGFPFGVLWPLCVVGLVLYARKMPAAVWGFLLLHGGAIVLVFVAGRYRIELIPIATVVASAGVYGLVQLIRRKSWAKAAGLGLLALTAVVPANLPIAFCEEGINFEAELQYDLGTIYLRGGDLPKAQLAFERAIEIRKDYADALNELGNVVALQGRLDQAIGLYQRAVKLSPTNAKAWRNMGLLALKQNQADRAEDLFYKTLAVRPFDAKTHMFLGEMLLKQGNFEKAKEHLELSVEYEPEPADQARTRFRLAVACWQLGKYEEAYESLQQARDFSPGNPQVVLGLAWLKATCPVDSLRNGPEAILLADATARQALSGAALDVLAAGYAETGDFEKAVETAQRALTLAMSTPAGMIHADEIKARLELYRLGQPFRSIRPPVWLTTTQIRTRDTSARAGNIPL